MRQERVPAGDPGPEFQQDKHALRDKKDQHEKRHHAPNGNPRDVGMKRSAGAERGNKTRTHLSPPHKR
jgi:hypothetical protein